MKNENIEGIFKQLSQQKESDEKLISKALGFPHELAKGFELKSIQSPFVKRGEGYLLLHPEDLHRLREEKFKKKE